jgi:Galactose oxidase, central domain
MYASTTRRQRRGAKRLHCRHRAAVMRPLCSMAGFMCWAAATRSRRSPTMTSSIPRKTHGRRSQRCRVRKAVRRRSHSAENFTRSEAAAVRRTLAQSTSTTLRQTIGRVVRRSILAIYVFGGESQARRQSLGDVLRLKDNGTWEQVSSMPTPRNFARAVVFDDAVYVIGGSPTPEASHASVGSAIVERFRVPCGPGRVN